MKIYLNKFGTTLTSRQLGKEAFLAFAPTLEGVKKTETVEVDFDGVNTLSPSWADEFLSPLAKKFGAKLIFRHADNSSVKETLDLIEEVNGFKFIRENWHNKSFCGRSLFIINYVFTAESIK